MNLPKKVPSNVLFVQGGINLNDIGSEPIEILPSNRKGTEELLPKSEMEDIEH